MAGSAPTNSSAVDFEKQQAAAADAKEAARQASLKQGQAAIDQIFNGTPTYSTVNTPYDWSQFKPGFGMTPSTGAPAGYTAVRVPGAAAPTATGKPGAAGGRPPTVTAVGADGTPFYSDGSVGARGAGGGAASAPTWGLQDASGKIYRQGDPLSVATQQQTGTTGGFGSDFYNAYTQKQLDYYQPQEQRQYDQAQRDLQYNLARAGTLQSSTAADKQGELAYTDAINKANIVSNANTQTGQLQNQIQQNKEGLINQLYATSDPALTANLAESSARASQLQDPTLTPMANLFSPALSAVGGAINAYTSPYSQYQPSGAVAQQTGPQVAPASGSSGSSKLYS